MKNLSMAAILAAGIFCLDLTIVRSETLGQFGFKPQIEDQEGLGYSWEVEDLPIKSKAGSEVDQKVQKEQEEEARREARKAELTHIRISGREAVNSAEIDVLNAKIAADSARFYMGAWLFQPRKNNNNPRVKRAIESAENAERQAGEAKRLFETLKQEKSLETAQAYLGQIETYAAKAKNYRRTAEKVLTALERGERIKIQETEGQAGQSWFNPASWLTLGLWWPVLFLVVCWIAMLGDQKIGFWAGTVTLSYLLFRNWLLWKSLNHQFFPFGGWAALVPVLITTIAGFAVYSLILKQIGRLFLANSFRWLFGRIRRRTRRTTTP